jgi:hypothetical protein
MPGIPWQVGNKLAKNTFTLATTTREPATPSPDHIRPIGGVASPTLIIVIRIQ